jgi:phosphopantothenoylcysteine decarboxylase/phosphopantothenate--cysteine ligase
LTPTVDILKEIGQRKGERVLIGFAAQTGEDGLVKAIEKYAQKNLDLIYLNDVSGGAIFGSDQTSGMIVRSGEVVEELHGVSKLTLADKLLDFAAHKLGLAHD